jgi:hypothetical protein
MQGVKFGFATELGLEGNLLILCTIHVQASAASPSSILKRPGVLGVKTSATVSKQLVVVATFYRTR